MNRAIKSLSLAVVIACGVCLAQQSRVSNPRKSSSVNGGQPGTRLIPLPGMVKDPVSVTTRLAAARAGPVWRRIAL